MRNVFGGRTYPVWMYSSSGIRFSSFQELSVCGTWPCISAYRDGVLPCRIHLWELRALSFISCCYQHNTIDWVDYEEKRSIKHYRSGRSSGPFSVTLLLPAGTVPRLLRPSCSRRQGARESPVFFPLLIKALASNHGHTTLDIYHVSSPGPLWTHSWVKSPSVGFASGMKLRCVLQRE